MKKSCHNCAHQKRSMFSPIRGDFAKCMGAPIMKERTGPARDYYKPELYVDDHHYCSTVAKNCPSMIYKWSPDLTTRLGIALVKLWKGWE